MKVVEDRVEEGRADQEFALYARLEIDPGEYRAMPSAELLYALHGSFIRLTEALGREFESLLGEDFRFISIREFELCHQRRRFSVVVQLRVEASDEIARALSAHWMRCAGDWVHAMGLTFPQLRGSVSVDIGPQAHSIGSLPGEVRRLVA